MALPVNVNTGTIRLNSVDLSGDTSDGTVTLKPSVPVLLDATATPPTTIFTETLTYTITGGVLADTLVPATDDPDLNPADWTYAVTIKVGAYSRTFNIEVPVGGVVDLTTASPVPSSGGTGVVRGAGIPDPASAADNDVVSWDATAGAAVWESVAGVGPSTLDSLTDVDTTGAVDGQTIVKSGTSWVPGDSGAVDSVNSQTGAVVLGASDVGAAAVTHTHSVGQVTGLDAELLAKADKAALETVAFTGQYADLVNYPTALSDFTGGLSYSQMPSGTMVSVRYDTAANAWPARPTAGSNIVVVWASLTDQGIPPQAVAGVDQLVRGVSA